MCKTITNWQLKLFCCCTSVCRNLAAKWRQFISVKHWSNDCYESNNFSNHRKLTNLKRTTCSLQKWRILPHWVGQQEFQRHKRPQRLQDTYKIKQYQVDNKLRQQAIVNSHAPIALEHTFPIRCTLLKAKYSPFGLENSKNTKV